MRAGIEIEQEIIIIKKAYANRSRLIASIFELIVVVAFVFADIDL